MGDRKGGSFFRLPPFIDWEPTPNNNVKVLNDTGDFI